METRKLLLSATILVTSEMIVGNASGITITFNELLDVNAAPFTTYSESGFTVAPTLGNWFQGQQFGNPVPSIFAGPEFGSPLVNSITITEGGQRFTFSGLDLAANNGDVDLTFTGTLGGNPVFDISATEPGQFGPFFFVTETSGVSSLFIDTLVVTTNVHGTSTNIDNILVQTPLVQTPEPTAVGTLATGLVVLGLLRWRGRYRRAIGQCVAPSRKLRRTLLEKVMPRTGPVQTKALLLVLAALLPSTAMADSCITVTQSAVINACETCMEVTVRELRLVGQRSMQMFAGVPRTIWVEAGGRATLQGNKRWVVADLGACQ